MVDYARAGLQLLLVRDVVFIIIIRCSSMSFAHLCADCAVLATLHSKFCSSWVDGAGPANLCILSCDVFLRSRGGCGQLVPEDDDFVMLAEVHIDVFKSTTFTNVSASPFIAMCQDANVPAVSTKKK